MTLRQARAYLGYVLRHKWHVLCACWSDGLVWRGIVHDNSKLRPSEFVPYAEHFYNADGSKRAKKRDETGYYKPTDTGDEAFDRAWLLHQNRNSHHWQYWVLVEDETGRALPQEMPILDVREMVCDWIGASLAQGHGHIAGVLEWYDKNGPKMVLEKGTRYRIAVVLEEWPARMAGGRLR